MLIILCFKYLRGKPLIFQNKIWFWCFAVKETQETVSAYFVILGVNLFLDLCCNLDLKKIKNSIFKFLVYNFAIFSVSSSTKND